MPVAEACDSFVGQRKMMRSYLARNANAFLLRTSDGFDRTLCRNVCDVNMRTCFLRKQKVAYDIDFLRQGGHSF